MRALWLPPKSFLGVTKKIGEDDILVTHVELKNGISAGIYLRGLGSGIVTLQEEHTCRLENKISLTAWADMPEMEKALAIAQRRNSIAMRNLQTEAEIEKAKRDASKPGRR